MDNIKKIISFSKPLHKFYWMLTFLIVTSSSLGLVSPIIYKRIIDDIISQSSTMNQLAGWIALAFVIELVGSLFGTFSNRLGDFTSGRLKQYLTERFYAKVLSLNQDFFDSEISGKISNQLARGMEVIGGFANSISNFILPSFLQTAIIIAILSYYNIYIGLFIFALFPTYYFLTQFSTKAWGKLEEVKNKLDDLIRGRINEVLGNMRLVKSFTNEMREYKFISSNLTKSNAIYDKQSTTFHKIDFLRNISLNIILTLVSVLVFNGAFNQSITVGTVVLIFQYISLAKYPLYAMSYILTQVQMAESGSKEFFEIMHLESKEDIFERKAGIILKKPSISFSKVSFKYKDSKDVIDNVSFKLDYPQSIALVGHSGAGKSTIINMILKLYEPQKGSITLNGTDYSDLSTTDIRQNISLVFQDNELFSTSIRDNVSYGKPDATDKEIITALKRAQAWEFVSKMDKLLETEIGERGVRLSGGQKQRIQIARAILHSAPILILDEATSSLDSHSEMLVHEALQHLMKEKLVIIIAHRFSTIQDVDKIIVIDKGKVSDMGTPQELASRKGIYSELLGYQVEGNKKLLKEFEIV